MSKRRRQRAYYHPAYGDRGTRARIRQELPARIERVPVRLRNLLLHLSRPGFSDFQVTPFGILDSSYTAPLHGYAYW